MKRNLYFENYINNLQANIFIDAYKDGYEIVSFINAFMKSDIRKQIDEGLSFYIFRSSFSLVQEISPLIKKTDRQKYSLEAVEWLGFFYSSWHFLTLESSKDIIRFLSPKEGLDQYYILHQLDESDVIERAKREYNLSRNAHRKYELEKIKKFSYIANEEYFKYLASYLLKKLKNDTVYEYLSFDEKIPFYSLTDIDKTLGINVDVIDEKNTNLENHFLICNEKIPSGLALKNSIYFAFVTSNLFDLNREIENLRNDYPVYKRNYNYIYFYHFGTLYEINSSNEIYTYILPISQRKNIGILNRIK